MAYGKTGYANAYLAMQGDGNLVEYSASGVVVWSSGTAGHSGAYAALSGISGFYVGSAGAIYCGTPLPNTTFTYVTTQPADVLFARPVLELGPRRDWSS